MDETPRRPRAKRSPVMKLPKLILLLALVGIPPFLALALNVGVVTVSESDVPTGLVDGRLQPCPPGADCVCTEPGAPSGIAPLDLGGFEGEPAAAFDGLVGALLQLRGARLLESDDGYARFLFTTAYIKLADELELRLDAEARVIHLRAVARVDAPWVDTARLLVESIRSQWVPLPPQEAEEGEANNEVVAEPAQR